MHGRYRLDHRSFLYRLRAVGARRLLGGGEGLPTYPDAGRPWRIAEELDVNIFRHLPDGDTGAKVRGPKSRRNTITASST